jgi:hypothetical protein
MRFVPVILAAAAVTASALPARAQSPAAPAAPAAPFEGTVSMTVGREAQPITYSVRQGVMRLDLHGRGGRETAVIVNTPARLVNVLLPGQQMYVEQELSADSIPAIRRLRPTITRTGRTEQVAGHTCEHWMVKDEKGETVDACMAQGIGAFAGLERVGGGAWMSDIGEGGWFPLLATRVDNGETVLRVTAIDARTLDASLFTVPAGYQKLTVPAGARWGGQ